MTPLIGTSWKMNLTSTEADAWFRTLVPLVDGLPGRDVFVLPPFTSIWVARERLGTSAIAWGAQDVHPEANGAYTGDISAAMLNDLGCRFVEVGHSERRRHHGETPEVIAAKVRAVLGHGMQPILCVGESEPRAADEVTQELCEDLARCLEAVPIEAGPRVVVAYEPQWAIGAGARPADAGYVGAVVRRLREWLTARAGGQVVPVLYGGSVDEAFAGELLSSDAVDGLFAGRHALDPVAFAGICWAGLDRRERTA